MIKVISVVGVMAAAFLIDMLVQEHYARKQ